jgi:septal ring-binding cell division protein DamX
MHHDKKGKLLMLGNSQRDLSALTAPDPVVQPSPPPVFQPAPQPEATPGRAKKHLTGKAAAKGAKTDKEDKRRHREQLASELGTISEALQQLRARVADLHRLHLDREAGQAGLATQVQTLGAGQAQARGRELALESRVETLRVSMEGLRTEAAAITDALADIAVAPDRDTALFALEDRIQDAEGTIAELRTLMDQAPNLGDAAQLEGWAEGLADLRQGLALQGERLAGVEVRLAEDASAPAAARLEQTLTTLGGSLDGRIIALERDLDTLRDQNRRWREAERSWAEERIQGMRRGLAGGMGLLALLLLAGFAATWWHGERQLDLIAARMASVEQGARFNALAEPAANRVEDRLTPVLGQLGVALQGIQASTEALGARIAALPNQVQPVQPPTVAIPAVQNQAPAVVPETPSSVAPGEPRSVVTPDPVSGRSAEATAAALPSEPLAEVVPGTPIPAVEAAAVLAETPTEPSVPSAPSALGPTPVLTAAPVAAAQVPTAPAVADALILDSERYAIQLIGFRTPARIAAFARDQGIADRARWLRAPGKGRAWNLVVLGDYASRDEAQAALLALPPALRALSPLVRSLPAGTELMPIEAR